MEKSKIILVTMLLLAGIFAGAQNVEAANPLVNATISNYDPVPIVPGRTAEVWISMQNIGGEIANDLEVEFVDTAAFKLVSETQRITSIPVIGAQSEYLIKYTIKVSDNAVDGSNELILKYRIGNVGTGMFEKKLYLEVKSTEVPVTISSVKLNPETISPGSKATLQLSVRNLAQSTNIRDLTVSLGLTPIYSATTLLYDLPFVPIGSASQKTIGAISPGQTTDVTFEIAAYPDAESQIYKVPVTLSFKDDSGTNYNKSVLVGVEVNSKPDLIVTIESSELNSKVMTGDITFDIINRGLNNVKLMTLTLMPSPDFEVLDASNQIYIGNIDSDDFESARFIVKAKSAEKINFPVKIEYKDSLNNGYEQEFNLEYNLRGPVNNGGSSTGIIVVVVVIIIAAAVIILRRKKKNQRRT